MAHAPFGQLSGTTMFDDLRAVDPRFIHEGERNRHVAFPLGGIASGGFAISGSGRLVDWSIANRPGLQDFNGYSHFAIKAEQDGRLLDARVLNGPYDGNATGSPGMRPQFDGFGHGANRQMLAGLPHFRKVRFTGRFPTADLEFTDPKFPGTIRLTALSPFIPHNDRDSSMPVAMFAFEIGNPTDAPITFTLAGTLGNFRCGNGEHRYADGLLHLASRDTNRPLHEIGDLSIATDADDIQHVDYHYRGQWFDDLSVFWREFARFGPLPERHYAEPRKAGNMYYYPEHGTLAARVTVPPGERRALRFVIAWSFPVGDIYWFDRAKPDSATPEGPRPTWRNYYATQWADSAATARDVLARWDILTSQTLAFRKSLFGSTLPAAIIDAASSTLALLRTSTLMRLEDGELWAWEGQHRHSGSCEGSCTHVWNYQQALPYLFPVLERSLRTTEWRYNQLPHGGLTFRQRLPLGSGFDIIGPAADGHFGAVIKTFREWKLSGDMRWLRDIWPGVRRAIEYAWSEENPDRWDPQRTGILWGRQHHTLDMELFGPNSWLSSMYVAALAAAAEMGRELGDITFATECRDLADRGAAYINTQLFNGMYFDQKISLDDAALIDPFDTGRTAGVLTETVTEAYWSAEHGQLKYQVGDGCLSDQILGQWHADMLGLGGLLDDEKVTAALSSVYRHNFRVSLADHVNPARVYGFGDEAGLLLCTWPLGSMPMVPAPYAEEVWTGIEYASASHMIMHGLIDEGLAIVAAVRDRYDGRNRNPFNEIECGSYYARSLSAWALVNAWSGMSADLRAGVLSFNTAAPGEQRLFWSAGGAWGELVVERHMTTLRVCGGSIRLTRLEANGSTRLFDPPITLGPADVLQL
jgi:non-lysosomal glucosylceramidase